MINNIPIGNARNLLSLLDRSSKTINLKAGMVLKATVMNIENGNAFLRIATGSGLQENAIIKASSEIPLTKGQNIFLEVLGNKDNIQMRFMGNVQTPAGETQNTVPVKFLNMLAGLSESRLSNPDVRELLNMLKTLPDNIKTLIPEFKNLEKLLLDANQLNGKQLKAFVETSGIALETRLKVAVLNDPTSLFQSMLALQSEGDLKALLLKLKTILNTRNIVNNLKQAGLNPSEIMEITERSLRNIEFFQLSSRINDMFYTYLPVLWEGLKDSEFLFKKGRHNNRNSYTCDINLDLDPMGKLSISVTTLKKGFYISFIAEKPETQKLINANKKILEQRLSTQGLAVTTINSSNKKDIVFGKSQSGSINVRI